MDEQKYNKSIPPYLRDAVNKCDVCGCTWVGIPSRRCNEHAGLVAVPASAIHSALINVAHNTGAQAVIADESGWAYSNITN